MKRVVIIGPGASGKSTLARQLGEITGLRVIELDKVFWQPGLAATPHDQWVELQQSLVSENEWVMDGDLGPYDAIEVRLRAADTIIFLDFSIVRCAWRAVWRSRERVDFWLWLLQYRCQGRPFLMKAISNHAATAAIHLLRNPEAVRRFVANVVHNSEARPPSPANLTKQN
jgi:nicotinamide riboside kinase